MLLNTRGFFLSLPWPAQFTCNLHLRQHFFWPTVNRRRNVQIRIIPTFYEPLELHVVIQTPIQSLTSYRDKLTHYTVKKTWAWCAFLESWPRAILNYSGEYNYSSYLIYVLYTCFWSGRQIPQGVMLLLYRKRQLFFKYNNYFLEVWKRFDSLPYCSVLFFYWAH